jgi:aspartyl protease family protein
MRNFVFLAILAVLAAFFVPRLAEKATGGPHTPSGPTHTSSSMPSSPAAPRPSTRPSTDLPRPATDLPNNGRTFVVRQNNRGHYHVEGRVDGRRMEFMVDTGASIIAIPVREAARLGIHPARRDYTAQIRTANGTIMAAPTQLARVEIGGLTVRDVAAVILPDEALSENLLGMSFLSRLRRFEIAEGRLMMEQ